MEKKEEDKDDYTFYVKNLDTGETINIEDAAIKYNVMALADGGNKDDDGDFKIIQHMSEEDEDYYFDAMLENLNLRDNAKEKPDIPDGARLQFVRINGHKTVKDEDRTHCVFLLEIRCNLALPQKWTVYRRYSQFRKLSDRMRAQGYYVPVLPPKNSILGVFMSDFLRQREADLEAWLHHLAAQHNIDESAKDPQTNSYFREFLIEGANNPPYLEDSSDAKADSKFDSSESKLPEKKPAKICLEDFELIRVIGKGSFGKVTLVRKKVGKQLYALKVLTKSNILKRKQVEHTKTERRVLGTINHPFIVRLHYAFQTKDKLYFVLDYAAGGELFFHLQRMKKFPEHITCFYCAEITSALDTIHSIGVVYRDLKPENILLDAQGHIKLTDFGLAKENVFDATTGANSLCGTPEYLSPEVIDKKGHGTAVDWWNLGMVTYEMLTGLPPWYTTDKVKLFDRLRNAPLKFPYHVSRHAASFIQGLLTRDPQERLGSRGGTEVMRHNFFSGIDWQMLIRKEIAPPFNPCLNRKAEDDTDNFESNFTSMPVKSVDDSATGLRSNSPGSPTQDFQNFTYEDDGFLGRTSSKSFDEYSVRK